MISSLISAPFSIISETTSKRRNSNQGDIYEFTEEDIKFLKKYKKQIIIILLSVLILGVIIFSVDFIFYLVIFMLFVFFGNRK